MSVSESSQAEKMKAALVRANLTGNEIQRRLIERIELEYDKGNQADIQLINLCENMLWELDNKGKDPFVSHRDKLHQLIDAQSGAAPQQKFSWQKAICAIAAVLVLCVGIGAILKSTWIGTGSSPDGQQYIVQGHEASMKVIEKAIAEHEGINFIQVESVSEFSEHLGFDPGIPETIGDKWQFGKGNIAIFPDAIQLSNKYTNRNQPDSYINYVCTYFTDAMNAYLTYEQNCEGEEIELANGSAYMSINLDNSSACWQREMMVSMLSGTFDKQEGLEIITELIGGRQND